MERKIFAEIHLEAIPSSDYPDSSFPFLKCDAKTCSYNYPLKILFPDSASESNCQWIYPVIFGGGLVEGDNVNMSIEVQSKCSVLIASLSFPKVYSCANGQECQQHMVFDVHSHALLCVLPDPVVCFKHASYVQSQIYHLKEDSNVVVLDWFTSGRHKRGERWEFSKLRTSSLVFMNKEVAFREVQCLRDTPFLNVKKAMKNYNVFGTCLIMGPFLSSLFNNILKVLSEGVGYGQKYETQSLFAVSPLILNGCSQPVGCMIRFIAESVSQVILKLDELLHPLFQVIGGNPLKNK